jgi:hypothetical protein
MNSKFLGKGNLKCRDPEARNRLGVFKEQQERE